MTTPCTPDPARPMRVVILGGGSAGWMAAAAFSRFLEVGYRMTLVESDEIGTVGVGEATIPQIRLFNRALGIEEADFLRATEGSIKLGIEFVGWCGRAGPYIHGFGPIGRGLGLVPFHHLWLRARAQGWAEPLGAYSPNIAAARLNRYAGTEGPGGLVQAYHFDAGLYAAFLRRLAESKGVRRIEGQVQRVEAEGERILALHLADGQRVEGDFFIDASGFRSLLLGEALATPFESWARWLPCDRALAIPCARAEPLIPYTRATARPAGWQWRIPLRHRTGNGLVYASDHQSDAEAEALLLAHLDGRALAEPRALRFTAGRRQQFWRGNVVAIGLASGFLEPLESTSIHLVQSAIERILAFWPGPVPDPLSIAEYNRQTAFELERIRDFLILHYWANDRDEPFWRERRETPLPDSLAARLELFRATGRIVREGQELFTEEGWAQVLVGQGVEARAWHPLANQASAEDLAGYLALQARAARERAERLPLHAAYLQSIVQTPAAA